MNYYALVVVGLISYYRTMAEKKPFKKPSGGGGGGGNNTALELLVFGALAAVLLTYFRENFMPLIRPIEFLMEMRIYFTPWFTENLWWIQVVSIIASALFLWGTIHILRANHYLAMKKEQFLEAFGGDYVSRRRTLIIWKQIQKRLQLPDQNEWKKAILEADHILNEILKMAGYLGKMDDKLELLTDAQLSNIENVRRAHMVRDKIQNDPSFIITMEEALEVVGVYEQSFKELNLIREE